MPGGPCGSPGFLCLDGILTILHPAAVDPKSIVREIKRKTPAAPRYRALKGAWIKPAWAVRRMVEEQKWMISDAVREVVARMKLTPPEVAFAGIRAAYYEVKKKDWNKEPK